MKNKLAAMLLAIIAGMGMFSTTAFAMTISPVPIIDWKKEAAAVKPKFVLLTIEFSM